MSFPGGTPALQGPPKLGLEVKGPASLPVARHPNPEHFGPIVLDRAGGGEEAAQRGVEFSFVWEREGVELGPGMCPCPGFPDS